jgi:GT2 family glycosyltransferase
VTRPVSIVIPALDDTELVERALAPLSAEVERRAAGDEILAVDDSGRAALERFLAARFPAVRILAQPANAGFARALAAGIAAARHALVFAMNSDLEVEPGFLEPLVEAVDDPAVFAAVPRVVRWAPGTPADGRVESLVRLTSAGGFPRLEQPCLAVPPEPEPDPALGPLPVPFALGGAALLRAADFVALGGFDPLFEPFYLEDVDLGWRAWQSGRRVLYVPRSLVRHRNQATIGSRVAAELRDAVIERNLALFALKHQDGAELSACLDELGERARAAWTLEERAPLEALALVVERLDELLAARATRPPFAGSFTDLARATDPFAAAARRTP